MGPLAGFRIVEIAGIGPGQFCGMLLGDLGAELLRLERPGATSLIPPKFNLMNRGRPAVEVDLKRPEGVALILALCEQADALFEGSRPGVMERLGLGPDDCLGRNPSLVYGRMTGWGQDGPLAARPGHDGDYVALAGALHGIGEPGRLPVLPANLLGDFGGGGAFLAIGILAALLEAQRSGEGQVVDAAMVDGIASMTTLLHGMQAAGLWTDERGSDLLNGGAPFYRCYETRDGKAVVVCALEPQFFTALLEGLGIDDVDPAAQFDRERWPALGARFAEVIRTRDRDDWWTLLEDSDACLAPVLTLEEARRDPHLAERSTFVEIGGVVQPAPAPRFSRTSTGRPRPPAAASGAIQSEEVHALLEDWGGSASTLDSYLDAVRSPSL